MCEGKAEKENKQWEVVTTRCLKWEEKKVAITQM